NSDPLKDLIKAHIDFEQIHKNISEKKVKALALTAFNYSENRSICFYNSNPKVSPWERSRRSSQYCKITSTHVAASAAIPVVFKPVSLEGHYYGDGALRNTAPLSPIIHFGAKKVLHIGVKHDLMLKKPLTINQPPSVAEIFGSLLNGLFFDATEMDVERFKMANKIIDSNPNDQSGFRNIPLLCFKPSESLSYIAEQLSSESLPTIVSYLLRGLGNDQEYAELSSYLLFDKTYTSQLIQLGEKDAHNKKNEILEFFFGF
ncbi:MAG: patatin-like phospholipase family protein, partial [Bdellovibrionales bacterium]|nr:patatin-like phospholipase family protein [Bdellovibrionales bacterium]